MTKTALCEAKIKERVSTFSNKKSKHPDSSTIVIEKNIGGALSEEAL